MTVSTTSNRVVYVGNGITKDFPYTFPVLSTNDLHVTVVTAATQEVYLTLSASQYDITGIGGSAGGTLTYPKSGAALSSTFEIHIERIVPLTQEVDIVNQAGFNPDVIEKGLDRIVMMIQQLQASIPLAFKGTYSAGTQYTAGALVSDQSSIWIALATTTGNAPPTLPSTSNTYWMLFSSAGPMGTNGYLPGVPLVFDDTLSDTDPGPGGIAFNASLATPGDIDGVRISTTDKYGADITAWLEALDDSNDALSRALVFLHHATDEESWLMVRITSAGTDNTTYYSFECEVLVYAGTIEEDHPVNAIWSPTAQTSNTQGQIYNFSTDSIIEAEPPAGGFYANNATLASATKLWFSAVNAQGANALTFFQQMDDTIGVKKGKLLFVQFGDASVRGEFTVTGLVDNTDYVEVQGSWTFTSGGLLDGASVSFIYVHHGDSVEPPSFRFIVETPYTTSSPIAPAAGGIKFDDADLTAVSECIISYTAQNSVDAEDWVGRIDSTTTGDLGELILAKVGAPNCFISYQVTNLLYQTAGTYRGFELTVLGFGSTTPVEDDEVSLFFYRTGNAGALDSLYPEKTSLVGNDRFIIEDSEESNRPTPVKFSTLRAESGYGVGTITQLTSTAGITNFTPNAKTRAMMVVVIGGGGGGGGVANAGSGTGGCGAAGGGGERTEVFITDMDQVFKYKIGNGGAGGAAGNNAGSTGGNSFFYGGASGADILARANGGEGGAGSLASSGAWGASGGAGGKNSPLIGDISYQGSNGGPTRGTATTFYTLGLSGSAEGMGGGNKATNNVGAGTPGTAYGEGGTGGLASGATTNHAGGVGYQGIIIVTEYY